MTNKSSPLEQWNVTGKAERNVYTGNYGPILPNNQGTVNINAAPAPKVDRPPSNIPFLGTDSFVGRDQDLVRLHKQLQQENRIVITAVTGMGGVGKTELAVQYAQRYWQETFPGGVCWLSARGAEGDADIGTQIITFGKSYLGLNPPEDLDAKGQVAFCWQNWPKFEEKALKPESVLVVLDNVTDYRQVEPYLPHDQRFTVLMTTRVELGSRIAKLPIGVLARADALELLRQLAGAERIDAELETADALCEWLGDLPLGLELVGRFLARKPDLSLTKLRERLGNDELQARALKQTEEGMTANLGVASAFELSWQELSEAAQELACLLSCFALAPIPWGRVEACMPKANPEDLEDWRDDELVRLSLLKRVETGRYQYHQLIQRFIRAKLPEDSPLIGAFCEVMVAAAKEVDYALTKVQALAWSETASHVAEAATYWLTQVAESRLIWPFVGLGRFYGGQGLYTQAEHWWEKCLVVTRDRLGNEHLDVAISLSNLAVFYRAQGRYSEAELLYIKALKSLKRLLGDDSSSLAINLTNLAELYSTQGRYSEAEPLYVKALESLKRRLGNEHPDVATSLNNLAALYRAQGRYSEAEPLYVKALKMRKRLLGYKHLDVANSLLSLASLRHDQEKHSEAESLYVKALKLYKCLLGDEHPDVATSLNSLASLYCVQGRYSKAELLYVEALHIRKHLLRNDHPDIATSLNNLAELYRVQGRYSEAEPLYVTALEISFHHLGEDHPNTKAGLDNFIYCLQQALIVGQSDCLSQHPATQQLLAQLQSQPPES